jgi:hypothetical protein
VSVASPDLRGYGIVPSMVLETARLLGLGHEQFVVTVVPDAERFDGDDTPESRAAPAEAPEWWDAHLPDGVLMANRNKESAAAAQRMFITVRSNGEPKRFRTKLMHM